MPHRLIFSGGGTRCLVFLPTLERLEREGRLTEVREYWGTSAGAFLAALMALTRSPQRVTELMKKTDYTQFRDVNVMNLVGISESWGLDDGHGLMTEVGSILDLAQPGASRWTLSQLPALHVVVADLHVHETVVCSAANYPTMLVVEAIRASMSLPVFYRPYRCKTTGHVWVDGGLRAAFPWHCLPSEEARRESLGFSFERPWAQGPRTFTEFLLSMVHFEDPQRIEKLKATWPCEIFWFRSPPFPAWYVKIQPEDWDMLEEIGAEAFDAWKQRLTLHRSQGTVGNLQSSLVPNTPPTETPVHHTGELWDTRRSSSPSPSPAPARDLPPHRQLPSRRWSL